MNYILEAQGISKSFDGKTIFYDLGITYVKVRLWHS